MPIAINGNRLLEDLHAFRRIGGQGTGVVRRAFSPADIEARRLLAAKLEEFGHETLWDPVGNLFGLPPGAARPILIGSHSDTQPEGGWLDGIYGVLVGLEVARASAEGGGPPVAVVSFQDEEGAFASLLGSRYWTGQLARDGLLDRQDSDGRRLGDLIEGVPEIRDAQPVPVERFRCFLEAHIEQGPVLDEEGEALGVVQSIVGTRQFGVTIRGQQNHAGTTPMDRRRDAVTGLTRFAGALHARFQEMRGAHTVWTIGRIVVHPNATSIVPGRVELEVQMRDQDGPRLDAMAETLERLAAEVAEASGLDVELAPRSPLQPTPMAPELIETFAAAAEATAPGQWRHMPSGAMHDAMCVAPHLPTGMLFVPSLGGVSHAFEEDTREADLVTGCAAMARAVELLGA